MKVTVNKVDEANVIVSGTIANDVVEAYINTMAAQAGKEMKVDGFRKGKVPAHVVKNYMVINLLKMQRVKHLKSLSI